MTVAFQGWPGAYSDAAARTHFPVAETLGCASFAAAVRASAAGRADAAVIPVRNSTTGAVAGAAHALDLAARLGLRLDGEFATPIRHALLGLPGASVEQVRVVRSHPQALAQCARSLAAMCPEARIEAAEDTAGSARDLAHAPDPRAAAVAHASAAARYGLVVLADGVEDDPSNATTFAVLLR